MAIISFSGLVAHIVGKMGGSYIRRNGTGYVISNIKYPINPLSPNTNMSKGIYLQVLQSWSTLTEVQRSNWDSVATTWTFYNRLGTSYTPTGYQLWTKLNMTSLNYGFGPVLVPVAPAAIPNITLGYSDISVSGNRINVAFNPTPWPAGTYLLIYASAVRNAGNRNTKCPYKLVYIIVGTNASPAVLYANWVSKYGSLTTKQIGGIITFKLVPFLTVQGVSYYFNGVVNA